MTVMTAETLSRRTITFVNIAHAFDHFVLLIYPTAVIAIAAERGLDYASLITLATGAFVAFGLCSLPMGWIAERVGRRNMLAIFFFGYGVSCFGIAATHETRMLAVWLLILGVFSAIYHPIGTAMLVANARQLGRDLGWNGVWGNIGAALASAVTAFIAVRLGWRAAFVLPGIVCILVGVAFFVLVAGDAVAPARGKASLSTAEISRPLVLLAAFAIAVVAGGMTFNITTIALPKIIDEGLGTALPLALVGSLATLIFVCGALTQLAVGWLVDRYRLPTIFVGLSLFQPLGLALAATSSGIVLVAGLLLVTSAIYGQVVINDTMIARYIPDQYRAKAYSVRYFLGFTASGFAAPLIALLHGQGGFPRVLTVAALFGAVVVLCAIAFKLVDMERVPPAVPAE